MYPTRRFHAPALLVAAILVAGLAACANLNPIAVAETPAQKAYAIERAYNIVLEQAVELARTNQTIRDQVQLVEARTTPIIDSLSAALADYEVARAQFETGQTNAERVTLVAANLETWISQAQGALVSLNAALE